MYSVVSPNGLPGLKNYKYTERLTMLDLASLELRRLWFDLYWCYKLVFGLVGVHNELCNLFELKSDCVTMAIRISFLSDTTLARAS